MRILEKKDPAVKRSKFLHGFTLIEILVVIIIISLLTAISFTTFSNVIYQSKERATAATISKIQKILQQRREAFDRLSFQNSAAIVQANGIPTLPAITNPRIAVALVKKVRFQQAFPQRIEERSVFESTDFSTAFTSSAQRPQHESSAILYLTIMKGETFGAPAVDDDTFSSSELRTVQATIGGIQTDITFFVDAWGQPLRFYRCPTSLLRPTLVTSTPSDPDGQRSFLLPQAFEKSISALLIPTLPSSDQQLGQDPDDPSFQFTNYFLFSLTPAQQRDFPIITRIFHAPNTFHVPLIVSCGADQKLGLFEPNDTTGMHTGDISNVNSLARPGVHATARQEIVDNLTNYNLRNRGL